MNATALHRKELPPALAVLSCTLALLAAQPAATRAAVNAPVAQRQVELVLAHTQIAVDRKTVFATPKISPRHATTNARPAPSTAGASHRAFMMSLYVLQHVLAGKLSQPSPLLHAATLATDPLPQPSLLTHAINPSVDALPLSPEAQFLLTRTLLAPPV